MPRLVFRPEARQEAKDGRDWYANQADGLGLEFTRAIDAVIAGIQRFPESFPVVAKNYRQAVLRRFPYSIIYEITKSEIVVLRCFHHRRDPDLWRSS